MSLVRYKELVSTRNQKPPETLDYNEVPPHIIEHEAEKRTLKTTMISYSGNYDTERKLVSNCFFFIFYYVFFSFFINNLSTGIHEKKQND